MTSRSSTAAALRAFPTLLKVGVAEAVAYRTEFLIWALTTTLPLVMMALWLAVARDGPIGGFRGPDFVAYYLAAFVVRQLTGCWVAWEMNMEIRDGTFSMRMLRPLHPLIAYGAENVAALPLRLIVSLPVALIALFAVGHDRVTHDPRLLLCFAASVVGAWLLTFFIMAVIGTLAFFIESTYVLIEIWFAVFGVFSGYLVPIALLPAWVRALTEVLPFKSMLGLPVEIILGMQTLGGALRGLALEWAYVLLLGAAAVAMFRAGTRKYSAYGS
jgi:ABC-2 type transport system permease protein